MSTSLHDVTERTQRTRNNRCELMLFRLGHAPGTERRELFGINVFKVPDIMVMPTVTAMFNTPPRVLGEANVRGQIIPVIDLPAMVGCTPVRGRGTLLVTGYACTTQAFVMEEVDEIVRLDWRRALAAEGNGDGDGDGDTSRLVLMSL